MPITGFNQLVVQNTRIRLRERACDPPSVPSHGRSAPRSRPGHGRQFAPLAEVTTEEEAADREHVVIPIVGVVAAT
jgi:hypothetical protein